MLVYCVLPFVADWAGAHAVTVGQCALLTSASVVLTLGFAPEYRRLSV